jgi:hypothetical protein
MGHTLSEQLQQLYARDSQLHHTHDALTQKLDGLRLHEHSRRITRLAVAVTIFQVTAAVYVIAARDASIISDVVTVTLSAFVAYTTLSGPARTQPTSRRQRNSAAELAANDATYTMIDNLLNGAGTAAQTREQTEHVLRAVVAQPYVRHEHLVTHRRRHIHLGKARTHVAFPWPPASDGNSNYDITDVSVDKLMLFYDWPSLGTHIEHRLRWVTSTVRISRRIAAADILQQLCAEHGTDVLTTANLLATDDPQRNHHWNDLIATATALTPA